MTRPYREWSTMPGATPDLTIPTVIFLAVMIGCPVAAIILAVRERRQRRRAALHDKAEAIATKWEKRPTGRRARASLITSAAHTKHMRDSRPDHRIGNNPPGNFPL